MFTVKGMEGLAGSDAFRLVRALVRARQQQGRTQQDVATLLGVTRQAVAQWEKSGGDLHVHTLTKWMRVLGLHLEIQKGNMRRVLVCTSDGAILHWREPLRHAAIQSTDREARLAVAHILALDWPGSIVVPQDNGELVAAAALWEHNREGGVMVVDGVENFSSDWVKDILHRGPLAKWAIVCMGETSTALNELLPEKHLSLRDGGGGTWLDEDGRPHVQTPEGESDVPNNTQ